MVNNGEELKSNNNLSPVKQLFLGEYQPNVTRGSRIALPKKIREPLGKGKKVVLARGFEGCISGYSKDFWQIESGKALSEPGFSRKGRMLKRYMFSGAFELGFDSQGRVVLPKALMDYSQIKMSSEVVLIGAGDHFEIWNKQNWENNLKKIEGELL